MAKVYESDAFVEYMANQAQDAEDYFGLSQENAEPSDNQYASLDTLRDIAVNLGTDKDSLQTCIEEWRYVQAVNDMMNQANQLFGVNWTPGNVIIDRQTGNFKLVSGAQPADAFVPSLSNSQYSKASFEEAVYGTEWNKILPTILVEYCPYTPPINAPHVYPFVVLYTPLFGVAFPHEQIIDFTGIV